MELHIATRTAADEGGKLHRFLYFLTVDVIEAGNFCCENYGVRIAEEGGASVSVPALTTNAVRIDRLMTALVDGTVGPVGLRDVIADWI